MESMRRSLHVLFALAVAFLSGSAQAQARAFINPWGGVIFGNDAAAAGFHSYGVTFGSASHSIWSTETTVGFSPHFFGTSVDNYVLDLMAGVVVGPTLRSKARHEIRPYGLAEVGTVRTSIDSGAAALKRNDIGLSFGGGATLDVNDRLAVRGDVRYFRALGSDAAANTLQADLADFHYWRAAIGVLIH
jgi:opacity protein-like surface antigen